MTAFYELDSIELITSEVLRLFGGGREEFIATERVERFDPTLPWIHLVPRWGGVIGMAWGEPLKRGALLARTVSVGRRLRRSPHFGSYLVTENFGPVSPRFQRTIEPVISGISAPIRVALAEEMPLRDEVRLGPISTRILEAPLSVTVQLYGLTGGLRTGSRIFFDALELGSIGRRFRSRSWRMNGGKIVVTVEEDMEDERRGMDELLATEIHVTVDIGAFQMSLGDLLGLRPGRTIELPVMTPLKGILKVEGASMGLVTLRWGADSLMATLEEMSLFSGIEKNDGENGNGEENGAMTEGVLLLGKR